MSAKKSRLSGKFTPLDLLVSRLKSVETRCADEGESVIEDESRKEILVFLKTEASDSVVNTIVSATKTEINHLVGGRKDLNAKIAQAPEKSGWDSRTRELARFVESNYVTFDELVKIGTELDTLRETVKALVSFSTVNPDNRRYGLILEVAQEVASERSRNTLDRSFTISMIEPGLSSKSLPCEDLTPNKRTRTSSPDTVDFEGDEDDGDGSEEEDDNDGDEDYHDGDSDDGKQRSAKRSAKQQDGEYQPILVKRPTTRSVSKKKTKSTATAAEMRAKREAAALRRLEEQKKREEDGKELANSNQPQHGDDPDPILADAIQEAEQGLLQNLVTVASSTN